MNQLCLYIYPRPLGPLSHCSVKFLDVFPYKVGLSGVSDDKESPAVQETWVRSLGREDPLGEGMATHSSILAWRIPWTEEPGGLQCMGLQELDMTERPSTPIKWQCENKNHFFPYALSFLFNIFMLEIICSV